MEKYLNASLVPNSFPCLYFFCTASDWKAGRSLGTRQLKYHFTCTLLYEQDTRNFPKQLCCSEWCLFHMFTNELLYCPFEDYFWYSSCDVPTMAIVYNTRAVSETVPLCLHQTQHKGCIRDGALVLTPDPPIVWWPGQWHCQEIPPVCCTPVLWSSGNTGTHSWGKTSTYRLIREPLIFLWNRLHKLRALLYSSLVVCNPSALS